MSLANVHLAHAPGALPQLNDASALLAHSFSLRQLAQHDGALPIARAHGRLDALVRRGGAEVHALGHRAGSGDDDGAAQRAARERGVRADREVELYACEVANGISTASAASL